MNIIYAEKYVSPRERPLTPEEQEVRRISYALKVPIAESTTLMSHALAPLSPHERSEASHQGEHHRHTAKQIGKYNSNQCGDHTAVVNYDRTFPSVSST